MHRDRKIDTFHTPQNIRHEIALLETGGVAPVGHLVIGRAVDVVEDRAGQPALRQAAKVVKVMAVVGLHRE